MQWIKVEKNCKLPAIEEQSDDCIFEKYLSDPILMIGSHHPDGLFYGVILGYYDPATKEWLNDQFDTIRKVKYWMNIEFPADFLSEKERINNEI